ncbi:MAG: hypothetical protein ACYTGG_13075 [Planctomycetota bacterium]
MSMLLGAVTAVAGSCGGPSPPAVTTSSEEDLSTSSGGETASTAPATDPEASNATEDSRTPQTSTDARPPVSGPGDDPTVARFHGLVGPKPGTWIWHPPQNRMRTANWTIPGRDGSDMAELVVFAFPAGDGGTREQNIQRWASRFRAPDGAAVEPVTRELEVAGLPVTLVELIGDHMKMGAAWFTPDQMLLGGIVERSEGMVFIRLTGPTATVEAHRAAFERLILGLRPDRIDP